MYTLAKDYDHVTEIKVSLERDGSMTLARIAEQLGERPTCHVSEWLWIAAYDTKLSRRLSIPPIGSRYTCTPRVYWKLEM